MSLATWVLEAGGREYPLALRRNGDDLDATLPDGRVVTIRVRSLGADSFCIDHEGRHLRGAAARLDDRIIVSHEGRTWTLRRKNAAARGTKATGGGGHGATIDAPMTGTVVEVKAAVGATVEAGETLVVVSAMKMEHRLTAPARAEVTEILVAAGQLVDIGQVLVRLGPVKEPA